MKGIRGILLFWSLFCLSAAAFQWPVDQVILKQTFGEGNGSDFNTGITLGGDAQDVHPIESGEVLYYYRDDDSFAGIPSGLGNFIVMEHERSLFSVYSHLDPDSPVLEGDESRFHLTGKDVLGRVGSSGDAPGKQLNLEIVDLEFNQMVNPLKLLPPLKDSTKPVVEGVYFRSGGWKAVSDGMSLPPGEQELFIVAYDQSEWVRYFRPMAPFKINIFANGEEMFFQTFEAVESREGLLYLVSRQELRSFRDLYAENHYIRVGKLKLTPGETSIEIIVSDYRGNKTLRTIRLRVTAQP